MTDIERDLADAVAAAAGLARGSDSDKKLLSIVYLAIYASGYRGGPGIERFRVEGISVIDHDFCDDILRAVPDRQEETGWTVEAVEERRLLLARDGIRAFVPAKASSALRPGQTTGVAVPAVRAGQVSGFLTRRGIAQAPGDDLSRIYLNLRTDACSWALGSLARELDASGIAFTMKVLAHPQHFVRRDSGVLYVSSPDLLRAVALVATAIARDRPAMDPEIPLATFGLAPGLGYADDPSDLDVHGQSYGQWVATVVLDAARAEGDPADGAVHARRIIRQAGRDPARPFLRGDRRDLDLEPLREAAACLRDAG